MSMKEKIAAVPAKVVAFVGTFNKNLAITTVACVKSAPQMYVVAMIFGFCAYFCAQAAAQGGALSMKMHLTGAIFSLALLPFWFSPVWVAFWATVFNWTVKEEIAEEQERLATEQ